MIRVCFNIWPMLRRRSSILAVETTVLAAALLAYPCGMLAQQANPGGVMGGGTSTGVDVKDDLKDFHQALAVQATRQQVVEYNVMLKSTAAASSELQAFLQQLDKRNNSSEITNRGTTLQQALEKARTENQKFLDGLSGAQTTGLREITRKLTKADSELANQSRELEQQVGDAKTVGPQIENSARGLERTLATFRSQQLDLGEKMSIEGPDSSQVFTFTMPPVKNSVNFANQPIVITTVGVISKGATQAGQNAFTLELIADMSDLQQNIAEVLRTRLDQANRCGDRVAIRDAALTPLAPSSVVVAQFHFERWACFGRDAMNEMVEGNGTIEVKLTPAVAEDGALRLVPEIERIDAQGLIGEMLRSGTLGEALRDKIAESLLLALRGGTDFKTTLPPAAQSYAILRRAEFQGTGSGKLLVVLDGEIPVSGEQATSLAVELQNRSSSQANVKQTTP